jgi:hypothetical protein
MSVTIDNITYNIEDENLMDIEYYEILTLNEIIKDNPTFIAFSREEVFNELYDFVKDSNKADKLIELFFKDNKNDVSNFVFVVDAEKKKFECMDDDMENFVNTMKKMSKLQYRIAQTEKNKLLFPIKYEDNSKLVRFKPQMHTTLQLNDDKIRIYYPLTAGDDINIPVIAIYYKKPVSTLSSSLSTKICGHLQKCTLLNYADSSGFADINKLIKAAKPDIETILPFFKEHIDVSNIDYDSLNTFLESFGSCLEDLNIDDLTLLKEELKNIVSNIKEDSIKYKKYKLKSINVLNEKIEFFNKINIKHILQLLTMAGKTQEKYQEWIEKLQDDKININAQPLLYNNINDIITAVINNDVSLEDIIDNLKENQNVLIIDNNIHILQNLLSNNVEEITDNLNILVSKFKLLQTAINDIYEFHFIDFYHELKEIKEGGNYDDYIGIPDVYKNDPNFTGITNNMYDDNNDDLQSNISNISNSLEKYWLSIKYKNAVGFVEILQIILPIIDNIKEDAKLPINYEILCDELFKYFAGVSSKYNILYNILHKANITLPDNYIKDMSKIKPSIALQQNAMAGLMSNDIAKYVYDCNLEYANNITNMLLISIAWWSLQIQDDILNYIVFDENKFLITYIDKWSLDGLPLKDSKQGVLVYLVAILEDILTENNPYNVTTQNLVKNIMKKIEDYYAENLVELQNNSKKMDKKRQNKGSDTYNKLLEIIRSKNKDQLLQGYINALMYMPAYKFKKIHKFLLGCCLQHIGNDFVPDSDLKKSNRMDIIAAKKKYAKSRATTQSHLVMYRPLLPVDEEDENEDKEVFIYYEAPKDDFSQNNDNLRKWLNKMHDVSPMLPSNRIEEFIESTKIVHNYVKLYIQTLCKTAGYKSIELETLFQDSKNHKNILIILCTIYKKSPANKSEDSTLLQSAIKCLHDIIKHLDDLITIVDDYNRQDIIRIQDYILARALCLPFNPNITKNNVLSASIDVSSGFVTDIAKTVYNTIIKYMRTTKMPTVEENMSFINSIREQNKNKTLNVMNTKTQEERNLMNALKKIGLKYEDDADDNMQINQDVNKDDDKMDDDAESDFNVGNQDDYDDDDLDIDDYGFIYS